MILFFALWFVAMAIAGATAFVIFWPLSLVHLRDKHPASKSTLGEFAFLNPKALWWLLSGRYRTLQDRSFTGLATPARISLTVILAGLFFAALLYVFAVLFPGVGG